MGKLDKKDVTHISKLANLSLSPKELEIYLKQLSEVLDYVDMLAKVDTSNIEPVSQTTGLTNVTRLDEVKIDQSISSEDALSNTKDSYNDCFVVPAILENKDEP